MTRELLHETVTPDGVAVRLYAHPNVGFQVYVGGGRVATRKTRAGADRVVARYENA